MVNRVMSFFAGALCGALVGSVTALLLTPASGETLKAEAAERWEEAMREARSAMVARRQQLEAEFEQAKGI